MNVTYKIRVNRPCKLFIDQEETQILDELDLVKIQLPKGEYLRKVISIDDSSIFDEAIIVLDGSSKIDIITLDTKGLDAAKANALPNTKFKIGNMYYQASIDKKYREEGLSWWPQEVPSEEEIEEAKRNLKRVNYKVDYIVNGGNSDIGLESTVVRVIDNERSG